MRTMKVSEARKFFAHALESVVSEDRPLVIVRYRRAIAAIVPINRLSTAERTAAQADKKFVLARRRNRRPS